MRTSRPQRPLSLTAYGGSILQPFGYLPIELSFQRRRFGVRTPILQEVFHEIRPSAFSTTSGVIGILVIRTPNGERASFTALMTAAAAPAVPASPAPFAPSSISAGG